MVVRLFSQEWAAAWRREINASAGFRERGSDWRGSLVLVIDPQGDGSGEEAVFVELHEGKCTRARRATAGDRRRADLVIRARQRTWQDLFAGHADLLLSIMLGRFSLERGSLDELRPHLGAARELLRTAGKVDTGDRAGGDPAPSGDADA
ncbi:MAG: SCP2 sterol-binding domain-containing protein [Acidobacteriota bacterium]